MDLTLILGPMKSGKSFDLISYFAPLQYTDIPYILYQSSRNVRDEKISSRNGVGLEAKKVPNLHEALESNFTVVGIDELHMFEASDVAVIAKLLSKGVKVVAAGLDSDYKGAMFDIVKGLLELGPKEVKYKRAVCELCRQPNAVHTQVFISGAPITQGMPSVIPDDGTFTYQPVCHNCFVTAAATASHGGASTQEVLS
jgi:thymidine kinase